MNAISKRLLSWLVVIAMVLSFVPVMDLSNFAVTTNAAEEQAEQTEEIPYGSANLTAEQQAEVTRGNAVQTAAKAIEIPEEGDTFEAECPVCKTLQTWTKKTNSIGSVQADGNYHYAWVGEINPSNNAYNWISTNNKNATVCVLMKDAVINGGGTIMVSTNGTLNLMGTGTLTSDGSRSEGYGLLKVSSTNAKLNVYGGTYIYTGNFLKDEAVTYASLKVGAGTAVANIYADAVIGKAAEDTTATSYNVLVTAGTLNMYGGTIRNGITGDVNFSGNITLNGTSATVNMYGGTISGGSRAASASVASAGHAVRISNSGGYFNMYGGLITGGKSWNGGQGASVYTQVANAAAGVTTDAEGVTKGVLNLQGGTITGGQSNASGGNVSGWRGTINIGGTVLIENGQVKSTAAHYGANLYIPNAPLVVNITGGKIAGGTAKNGGNIYYGATSNTIAQLNITGGVISGGTAEIASGGLGGNIYLANNATISGGTITGGTAKNGGNIYYGATSDTIAQLNIAGGVISGGTAEIASGGLGGNIYFANNATISGGTITGGTAWNGGNIAMASGKTLNITGGTVELGTVVDKGSTTNDVARGGNIYADGGDVTIGATAQILDGRAKSVLNGGGGGNIYMNNAKLTTYGTITGGRVEADEESKVEKPQASGGNIHISGDNAICQVEGGVIANGYVDYAGGHGSPYGGNIRAWNASIIINDGLIYGGTGNTGNGANIGALGQPSTTANKTVKLHINGGIIVGDICYADYVPETVDGGYTFKVDVKLTGSPKIYKSYDVPDVGTVTAKSYGLKVTDKATLDISELSAEAHIEVTCARDVVVGKAFTVANSKAATVLSAFHSTNSSRTVALTDDSQQLQIIERTISNDKFEPEAFDGQAYCPVCGSIQTWEAYEGGSYNDSTAYKSDAHLYLAKDITLEDANSFLVSYKDICFNLNGHDITRTVAGSPIFHVRNFDIMDTEGGAVVTGYASSSSVGAAIHLNNSAGKCNVTIHSGTYTKQADDTKSSIAYIGTNGGSLTIKGSAIIDATGKTGSAVAINGGDSEKNSNYAPASFTMKGGEIKGGTAAQGGSVNLNSAFATFTMEGGLISGGKANIGGNIRGISNSTIEIKGGTICNGTIENLEGKEGSNWGGNIYSWNSKVVISGGLIYGGYDEKGNSEGANVAVLGDTNSETSSILEISGGTIVGDISISAPSGTFTGTTLKLSGAPQIVKEYKLDEKTTVKAHFNGLYIPKGGEADVSGLTAGAKIVVKGTVDTAISKADFDASAVLGCFTAENDQSYMALNEAKQLVIAKAGAGITTKDGSVWYATTADAVAAYTGEGYLITTGNSDFVLTNADTDYYIESRGYTVNVSGEGKLYALDRANDDYDSFGRWYVDEGVEVVRDVTNPLNGNRYIVIDTSRGDESYYTAHRVEMILTHVSLRAPAAGWYYKAQFKADSTLASRVMGYGVILDANMMPGAEFLDEDPNTYPATYTMPNIPFAPDKESHVFQSNSNSLFGILKDPNTTTREVVDNDSALYNDVYANLYLAVDVTGNEDLDAVNYFLQDVENVNKESGFAYSLMDVLVALNNKWNDEGYLTDAQKEMVTDYVETWTTWVSENVKTDMVAQLANILA